MNEDNVDRHAARRIERRPQPLSTTHEGETSPRTPRKTAEWMGLWCVRENINNMPGIRVLDNDEACEAVGHDINAIDRLTPNVLLFCSRISTGVPVLLPFTDVSPEPNRLDWCFRNVEAYVGRHGGSQSLGWLISRLRPRNRPPVYVAMFHCVWMSPEGDLVDITHRPGHDPISAFLPDPTRTATFTGAHTWTYIFMNQATGMMVYEQVDGSFGPKVGPFRTLIATHEKLPCSAGL